MEVGKAFAVLLCMLCSAGCFNKVSVIPHTDDVFPPRQKKSVDVKVYSGEPKDMNYAELALMQGRFDYAAWNPEDNLALMQKKARLLGADALINARCTATAFGSGCTATAVRFLGREKRVATAAPIPELKLAVMELEDSSGRFKRRVMANATDYLRGKLSASRRFAVIDRGRQEKKLKEVLRKQKRESHSLCYDEACQIPLGRALAADTVLRSTILRVGPSCAVNSELVDLAKEAALAGAIEKFDCTEKGLSEALDGVAEQLVR